MRISSLSLSERIKSSISNNNDLLSEKYLQISSGKKYLKCSDAPAECNEIASVESEIARNDQWINNIESAQNWEVITDAKLSSILEYVQQARELTVEANAGTLDSSDLKNLAVEFNEVIEGLCSELNSEYLDSSLFAGAGVNNTEKTADWNTAAYGDAPKAGDAGMPAAGGHDWADLTEAEYNTWVASFLPDEPEYDPGWISPGNEAFTLSKDDSGTITGITYNGSENYRKVQTSSNGATSNYGTLGSELISYTNLEESPANSGNWVETDVNLINELVKLRDDLLAGETPDEQNCDRISAGLDNVTLAVVKNAVSQNSFDNLYDSTNDTNSCYTDNLSDLADLDLAAATVELSSLETATEALLSIAVKIHSLSILNYI